MAAGEGGAEAVPPPSPSQPGPLPGPERALEEAAASGSLTLAGRRLRHFPGGAARRWDLSDTTQADLSRNRFAEVPEDACHLMSLEGLSLYHNCLRSIPATIANLQALTYLNVSRNQLTSLPSCLCRLPLKVLIASNNKLVSLPEDIGALRSLRQLDVSSNELQSLPASMGGLESLRDLNIRRNQIAILPEELAELPLVCLDFSCNRVTCIPVCYRHLRHLQSILLENNPLQSPPAQICLKGKIHIFKYLNIEACSKGRVDLAEFARGSRPTGFGTCLPDDLYSMRQYGGLDSGFNSVDSGSKRWSGNESADEFSDLSFRIAELARDPKQLKRKSNGAADASDLDQVDYIDSSINGEEEEEEATVVTEGKLESGAGRSAFLRVMEPGLTSRASLPRPEPFGEERRRPEIFQLWQEQERQQPPPRPLWSQGAEKRESNSLTESSSSLSQLRYRMGKGEQLAGSLRQSPLHYADPYHPQSSMVGANSLARETNSMQKPSSFLFRSSSRHSIQRGGSGSPSPDLSSSSELNSPWRLRPGSQALDERGLMLQLHKAIESRLNIMLAEDLGEALANGVVLCQLVNHLHPRSIPFIHVPSPAVPKLNAVKSRKNVENFLAACHQLGVPEVSLCSASDLLQGNVRGFLRLLEALLLLHPPAGKPLAPAALSEHLAGFGVFYVFVMLLLYLAYCKLCGC
ncbi:LOW QUALITY PROTEIN: leucine-rich repeat and calponin homology domain-containing protein 4 [Sceloporus undulatus]|uniref:LOW QUALITY PROTEIN: leucine-rich repeat and calponin homology domain-containing protein 4 n=1 Tax=Sceloporus undulatus TaxID=8520 RepID=UPI001C4AAC39|nr:LOW QUALITY PROTEIN: leucine-rich repeat and calponin homology domain-containing protein 4 [Sceloporus undulatus]